VGVRKAVHVKVWAWAHQKKQGAHMSLTQLHDDRNRAHAAAIAFLTKPQNAETRAGFNSAMAEVDRLGAEIQRQEASQRGERIPFAQRKNPWTDPKEYRRAEIFERVLRNNRTDEDRVWLRENRAEQEGDLLSQIGSYSGLGFLVPAGFVYQVEDAMKYFAPLLDVCGRLDTASGNPMPYPTSNDVDQSAHVLGESVDASTVDLGRGGSPTIDQDVLAGHIVFGSHKYTTGVIKASLEMAQDSGIDLSAWLSERIAVRLGRGYERDLTVGDGSGKPTGILTAIANSGATPVVPNGSAETSGGQETGANSIGYTDLVRLEHSVDPSYRRNAQFMMNDQTLALLKKILDKFGRPLWQISVKEGAPDTILGYRYVVNQSVPAIGASETTVVFGDLKKYLVRVVKGLAVQVLTERFVDFGQIAYIGFARIDGNLLDAGTHPLNTIRQAS
jgi:HK97 family phage major capsid protein